MSGVEAPSGPPPRIYLDACCVSRPSDDQSQVRVHDEALAVLKLIELCEARAIELVSSTVLWHEISRVREPLRRGALEILASRSCAEVSVSPAEDARALELQMVGVSLMDALHVACAESAFARYFVTVDDQLRRRLSRVSRGLRVEVVGPAECVEKVTRG